MIILIYFVYMCWYEEQKLTQDSDLCFSTPEAAQSG